MEVRIPNVVIRRLAVYLRILSNIEPESDRYISSQELGDRAGVTPAQVRKDLAMFGQFGKPGVGYHCRSLKAELKRILNADRTIRVGIVGVGELGRALTRYNLKRFNTEKEYPFKIVALFDSDPAKIGTSIEGVEILPVDVLPAVTRERGVDVAIITVPAEAAQQVLDLIVQAGVKAVLNYAPTRLKVPEHVKLHSVDVSLDLHQVAYYLK
ncbi:MAG: redox-sensing transcriptional repressor Rex [Bacillota bacterium]